MRRLRQKRGARPQKPVPGMQVAVMVESTQIEVALLPVYEQTAFGAEQYRS